MKGFLSKTASFVLPFLLILVGSYFALNYLMRKKVNAELKGTEYLFLGHSQPEGAINDSLIPKSRNLAQGGEAYFYTYQKIKKILPVNPQIKKVFISFSNNQIDKKMDDWAFDDEHLNQYFAKYSFAMDLEDINLVLQNNPNYFLQANLAALESNVKFLLKGKKIFENRHWGGYLPVYEVKLDSLKKVNYIAKIKEERIEGLSETNIRYLKKIVQFCRDQNREIIFIRTPFDQDMDRVYSESKFQAIRKKEFGKVPFWDFKDAPLPVEGFRDYDHLNVKGATVFSAIFLEKLQNDKNAER